ncbi:MAG: PE domain-containing protein [Sciscionella sp.]
MSDENQVAGAAGDTGNVLQGTALGALLSGNGAAAGFSINYERVPQSIADLEHAAKYLEDQAAVARSLASIPAPGLDGVSLNAVAQIGKWASDSGANNLEANLAAGAKQLQNLAQRLREDLKTYLQVEELNIPTTPSPGLPLPSAERSL